MNASFVTLREYDRYRAGFGENGGYSVRTQEAFYIERVFDELDEKLGTDLVRKFYETIIPIFAPSDDFAERTMAKQYEGALRRLAILGKPFEFQAVLRDGSTLDVADWRGKVVLVNFWGTSCGPCVAEFPAFKALYEEYHDRGFEIVALSEDSDKSLDKFLAKYPYPWTFALLDDSKEKGVKNYFAHYGVSGIPTTFLLDRDGNVAFMQIGSNDDALHEAVEKLFAEQKPGTSSNRPVVEKK